MRSHLCDAFNIEHGMEQTSMTNAIKNRLNRKGFTLAEVLVTVAIILILAGVTFVSVGQYQKNLRLMEMDGTAKEIFIAAQNHLSVAKASGDLDRLAENANNSTTGTTDSSIGTKLSPAPSYAGNTSGDYYYVIHNVNSGIESYTPSGSDAILQMMLPFGALDETVSVSGNYAIVYELKSASVVAVLYSGAGNASFGNAGVINFGDDDVAKINDIYNDKSKRKSYQNGDVTAIVGCYTGTAGSAAIPTETLEAPKLEVKNENKLHVLVREAKNTDNITLVITGEQSGTTARRLLNRNAGTGDGYTNGTFDVTLDDITGDGNYRFSQLIKESRFTTDVTGSDFIPGENIIISAIASSTSALATPKESAKYTVSSLFDDVNETTNSTGDTKVYIKNLRHLENLGANVSGFTAALRKDKTSNSFKVVNITAEQKNDITMFSFDGLRDGQHIYGSGTFASTYIAANVDYPLSYDGGSHEIYDLTIAGYHKDNVEANAGIFGTVTKSLSVKNLVLRNDKIPKTSTSANAGMLLGKTNADLTVDGVLAYYHEENYNADNDSKVEVVATTDNGFAGGLIGLVSSGTLNVKNSAAAVYVKGGSAAGGLIGSVSDAANGSIVQSYAGGHTKDGVYDTEMENNAPKNQSAGRYNVQASGYAGGFIGVTTDKVTMNAVYSTASAYASSGDANSNSFAGSGTPNIQPTADGKKNYYSIGPHNGTDASTDETAKSEIQTGQVRRQATPYDRKLILKDSETEHKMDKTSYPLGTVRNLCEADTSVKDTDLPWFIKEHVGDWVITKKNKKSDFEIDNGNRLIVRINTGLASIAQPLIYKIKVYGESSKEVIYFNVEVKPDNAVTVKREYSNWNLKDISETAECITIDGTQAVQFYLDDITRKNGNFLSVCAERLWPGEDITVNVAPAEKRVTDNSVRYEADFKDENQMRTNSLFGYVENSDTAEVDEHNVQKIKAIKEYCPTAGSGTAPYSDGVGLIQVSNGEFYAQIDNSRHLQNLTPLVSYYNNSFKINITGAVQTDNIYWTGDVHEDSYTMSIQQELHEEPNSEISIWNRDTQITTDSCFKSLGFNDALKYYDGQNYKISGLKVNETGDTVAGLFAQRGNELTIKNLTMENASITSQNSKAGVLIGYAQGKTVIDNVHITGKTTVQGKAESGGLIGRLETEAQITNSDIGNITVISKEINGNDGNHAGGLVGYSKNSSFTMRNVSVASQNTEVIAAMNAGGLIGYMEGCGSLTLDTVNVTAFVTSDSTEDKGGAGGFFGYLAGLGAKPAITNCHYYGADIKEQKNSLTQKPYTANINAVKSAGGIIGYAACDVEFGDLTPGNAIIASSEGFAGGIIGVSGAAATLTNIESDSLSIAGKSGAGGLIARAESTVKIENAKVISKNAPVNAIIASSEGYAGGIIGVSKATTTLNNITTDSLCIAGKSGAGGLIANATSTVRIENAKVIGINAAIFAEQDAGGLIGSYTSQLDVSNSAVSAFIESSEGNAGGLIGTMPGNTATLIEKSYYGGRTVAGAYGTYTLNADTGNEKVYEANISGGENAGGLIGSIGNDPNLKANYCFSTGSVKTKSGSVGGFIGRIGNINLYWNNMRLDHCYSMGKVFSASNDSGATKKIGGFIGQISQAEPECTSVFYLNAFNLSSINPVGNNKDSKITKITNAGEILGMAESSDLTSTANTTNYDDTLDNQQYPYKNWAKSGENENDPITYYGDWPLPNKQLNGRIVYYHANQLNSDKTEGEFTLTGYDTSLTTTLYNPRGNFEADGFGIICETPNREDANKKFWYSYSLHDSSAKNDGYTMLSPEGSNNNVECSSFALEGKTYYFFRFTKIDFEKLQSTTLYFKGGDDTINENIIYRAIIDKEAHKVTFERVE